MTCYLHVVLRLKTSGTVALLPLRVLWCDAQLTTASAVIFNFTLQFAYYHKWLCHWRYKTVSWNESLIGHHFYLCLRYEQIYFLLFVSLYILPVILRLLIVQAAAPYMFSCSTECRENVNLCQGCVDLVNCEAARKDSKQLLGSWSQEVCFLTVPTHLALQTIRTLLRYAVFWHFTQSKVVVSYRRFRTTVGPIFKDQAFPWRWDR
jgi:hypothetical protein